MSNLKFNIGELVTVKKPQSQLYYGLENSLSFVIQHVSFSGIPSNWYKVYFFYGTNEQRQKGVMIYEGHLKRYYEDKELT